MSQDMAEPDYAETMLNKVYEQNVQVIQLLNEVLRKTESIVTFVQTVMNVAGPMLPPGALTGTGGEAKVQPW